MFYLVVIQKTTSGTTQSVWSYATLDEAISAFHSELAYRGEDRLFTSCTVLNECCMPVRTAEFWTRPAQ